MKKLSICLFMAIILSVSIAFASPQHLNGDSNYIKCDTKQAYTYYVDAKTLNVEEYAPPKYQLAIDIVMVENAEKGNTQIANRLTRRYRYNWTTKQMFMLSSKGWVYLNPHGSRANGADKIEAGEIAFQLAYNMRFGAE